MQLTYTLENIDEAARHFWEQLNAMHVFAFSGAMSAGKTTFIHHLCNMLQVDDTVSSPTFSLINEYHFHYNGEEKIIYHMDWYRIKNVAEAINSGLEDCITQAVATGNYCFIEWPEQAWALIPNPHVLLKINSLSPTERTMHIELIN